MFDLVSILSLLAREQWRQFQKNACQWSRLTSSNLEALIDGVVARARAQVSWRAPVQKNFISVSLLILARANAFENK